MRYLRMAASLVVVSGTAALLAAAMPVGGGETSVFWGCESGYTMQLKGTEGARCFKPGTELTANIVCAMSTVKAQDQFANNRDGCQSTSGLPGFKTNAVGNYTCPSGYDAKVQAGPDLCVKTTQPTLKAPSVQKML